MNATTRPDVAVDAPATMPLPRGDRPHAGRGWVSTILGALGVLVLGVLVFAVVTVSHESSRPVGQPHPSATATTSIAPVPVNHSTSVPAPSAQPPTSWSVTAVASTLAPPPAAPAPTSAAPKREPSVRQRLHDMFPQLFPRH
ncbi:hypothetical protein [Mycolicibacterium sphagni]|uniref:Uncharacterized protein n=1 Tax=Mycolicibacterium sphagni TaxID=1786 RepID=A0ABX2JYN7_9MYCO|nr:hypothetical protein [Mycolicibacterium sphagni]NTY61939.1 hypothetical protein [Mycolicibacterium sphagni]